MKHLSVLLALIAGLAVFVACEDDSVTAPPPPPAYLDLTEKWHVIHNLELAYNQRRLDKYEELLDDDFIFFLSAGDIGGGLPASWDRSVEMQAHSHLFIKDPPPPPPIRLCKSIQMDIQWEDDKGEPTVTWIEFTPPGSPGETWYTTTVFYDFKIEIEPDITYINGPGAKVQFTVRNAGTVDAPQWRLVEMRDLGSAALLARSSLATESTTWGQVKALYR